MSNFSCPSRQVEGPVELSNWLKPSRVTPDVDLNVMIRLCSGRPKPCWYDSRLTRRAHRAFTSSLETETMIIWNQNHGGLTILDDPVQNIVRTQYLPYLLPRAKAVAMIVQLKLLALNCTLNRKGGTPLLY
ncbi:hypothetical protein K438DRAFT_1769592 [Mycena galopus ATCC 62051]|nr:hypothetical protein K438DRAFT_1769592 [Mycena galopus ATCC 62051]